MNKFTLTMSMNKETKNTIVYEADDAQGALMLKTLYVGKFAFLPLGTTIPTTIKVTIEEA